MIINAQIPLHRLVLSLSEAMDYVNPLVADHQLHVALVSTRMARIMGYRGQALRDIFHAAALHDIGLLRTENRIQAIANKELEGLGWHGEAGFELLKDNEIFTDAAHIVRHHHAVWDHGRATGSHGESIPEASHILAVADAVDVSLNRDAPVLSQADAITEKLVRGKNKIFCPDCVEAFREVSNSPAFWLDMTSKQVYGILNREVDWPMLTLNDGAIEEISHIFGRLVDSLSPWTGTHSAGVAATAVALAARANFSERELNLMRAAGYLHDLGKITVPSAILDKPGKPTESEWAVIRGHTYHTFRVLDAIGGMPQICEWAAFHHERLDGEGYPFGHGAADLTLGSRIMAVADIFTAITEERPYREGMKEEQALKILNMMVEQGAIDGQVLSLLQEDFDSINSIRCAEQKQYAIKQRQLSMMSKRHQDLSQDIMAA